MTVPTTDLRNWIGRLYLSAMPCRYDPFVTWRLAVEEAGIARIVCLATPEEVMLDAPDYLRSRYRIPPVFDFPIPDFGAPQGPDRYRFWLLAYKIADMLRRGERVLIHCRGGIGRTGMLAAGVLQMMGFSARDAYQTIEEIGSHPETPEQRDFVRSGPPAWNATSAGLIVGDILDGPQQSRARVTRLEGGMRVQLLAPLETVAGIDIVTATVLAGTTSVHEWDALAVWSLGGRSLLACGFDCVPIELWSHRGDECGLAASPQTGVLGRFE